MAGAIMNKVWNLFGMDPEEEKDEEVYNNEEEYNQEEEIDDRKIWGKRNNKIVSMPQMQQVKMVISQPTSFEQSEGICDLLKEKNQ